MKIMFWSLYHGQVATTANLTALSAKVALDTKHKALVMHNQLTHNMLENYLKLNQGAFDPNKGIDPVLRELKNRNLRAEEISRYAVSLLDGGRLDVLMGSTYNEQSQQEDIHDIYKSLYNHATQSYDLVYIDAHAGASEDAKLLMENSDLIVVNINQNYFLLEDTKAYLETSKIDSDQCLFLIGNYHRKDRMSLKNIKRKYGFKHLLAMPYCTNFSEALNNQRVIDFIYKNSEVNEYDDNYEFMKALEEIRDFVLKFAQGKRVKGH